MLVNIAALLTGGKVFYGYYRLSRQEQATQDARESHEFALMCAFEKAGIPFDLALVRSDIMSGRRDDRKQLQWIFGEINAGRCAGIITRLDRMSRNSALFHEIERTFTANGALIYSLLDQRWVDFSDVDQWHKYYSDGLGAELESRKIGERIKLRNRHNRHKGKPHAGGPVPIGLKRKADGTFFVDPQQADVVQFIKTRFFADHSTTHLPAALLTEFGVKTTSAGLRLWFKNPLLRGHVVHGWKSKKDYGPPILNAHEAIINPSEAALIDSIFAANLGRTGKNSANKVYPLNKQMICGRCGGKACIAIGGRPPNKKAYVICYQYRYGFGCLDWVKESKKRPPPGSRQNVYDHVEATVIVAIQGRALELAAQASSDRPTTTATSPEILKLQAEVAQAEVQALTDPDYQPVLQSKRKKLDAALNALNAPERTHNFESILAGLETPAAWAAVEPIVRRHLYEELVERVLVWPDRVEVQLAF